MTARDTFRHCGLVVARNKDGKYHQNLDDFTQLVCVCECVRESKSFSMQLTMNATSIDHSIDKRNE